MSVIELKVPTIGESVTEVTLSEWFKEDGAFVEMDEPICEFESDKATLEFPAEAAGKLMHVAKEGDDLEIGDVVAKIDTSASNGKGETSDKEEEKEKKEDPEGKGQPVKEEESEDDGQPSRDEEMEKEKEKVEEATDEEDGEVKRKGPVNKDSIQKDEQEIDDTTHKRDEELEDDEEYAEGSPSPAAAKLLREHQISAEDVKGTGKGGRILKSDVKDHLDREEKEPEKEEKPPRKEDKSPAAKREDSSQKAFSREERREKMSRMRRTIARRLVSAKNETAMLTTFNEADMSEIIRIRKKYQEKFIEKYGIKLGFMSIFAKACAQVLMEMPDVNAFVEENEIIYHDYVDISIAISTEKGLVVPPVKNVESLQYHEIERKIAELAEKARNGKLTLEEMTGGTFTITNGGIFGSMMSTPILNEPQSAILGMHNIIQRPVAIDGEVVIKPMMYLALSYDHRVIDGSTSVTFLIKVKELLEDPMAMMLDI